MYNLYERSSMTINYQFPFYPYNNYQQPTCGGYGFQPTTMYNQQNPYRGFENSYIENILRMNLGKNATIYMNFENSQWGSKVFKGDRKAVRLQTTKVALAELNLLIKDTLKD